VTRKHVTRKHVKFDGLRKKENGAEWICPRLGATFVLTEPLGGDMKIVSAASIAILAFASTQLWAQESLVGRYNGSYEALSYGNMIKMGMTVVISSVENGQVKGVATRQRGPLFGRLSVRRHIEGQPAGAEVRDQGRTRWRLHLWMARDRRG
jgi:hypothetical protein